MVYDLNLFLSLTTSMTDAASANNDDNSPSQMPFPTKSNTDTSSIPIIFALAYF